MGAPEPGAKVSPGEGERRAQRGYVPQYDLAARVIYEALAAGQLRWVGLADRGAGSFDDIVLGLHDRIAAYQVKTSRDPESFCIKTVLLGTDNLLGKMLESRSKLSVTQPSATIETVYICDDYPRTNDNIAGPGRSGSSAAFIRAHEAHRLSWTLSNWRTSQFAAFVADVENASGLDNMSFDDAWRNMRFLVGGNGRVHGPCSRSVADDRRLQEVAALLPRLVADSADRDRWSVEEVLTHLGWRDPFGLRHGHAFPVDRLNQSNAPTQEALQRALTLVSSGYISVVGPPGAGKSTLLATGLLPTPRAVVVRYLAFLPNDRHSLGRAEAPDFLHDLIKQLKKQGLGASIVPGTELSDLREQFEALLAEASQRFQAEHVRTLIVVDGLDHVPREVTPNRSFLSELPLPHAVPEGVVFVLGTQRVDLDGVPRAVRDQAGCDDRCVRVLPLPREAVSRLADAANVPEDVDRADLYDRTNGHPLSVRYVVEGLLKASGADDRQDWLRNGPAYGGDVDIFYQRAWRDLERNGDAQRALAYVALAEGPIRPVCLDGIVGSDATDAAWTAAGHLMVRDKWNAWSIFHNSFRLFLRARTGLRHGVTDEASIRLRYGELADIVRSADVTDPQRWMELNYRARAKDYAAVAKLAGPDRFRAQFIDGRDPRHIYDDIKFGLEAAGALRRPELVIDLILSWHEISMRADALGDEVFDALIDLGDLEAALGLIGADGVNLSAGKGYELVDALLEQGDTSEARELFHRIEPINKLLGSEAVDLTIANDELIAWAERALVFRGPRLMVETLDRLQAREDSLGGGFSLDEFRTSLKLLAVRGQLWRDYELSTQELSDGLGIAPGHEALLLLFAAGSAFRADDSAVAMERLGAALPRANQLEPATRRDAAMLAARLGRLDLAAAFFDGATTPDLANRDLSYDDKDLRRQSAEVVVHAILGALLGLPTSASLIPDPPLLANYQSRLEIIGRLTGEGRAGRTPTVEPIQEFRDTLDFLQHAGASDHPSGRWLLDRTMDEAVAAMVEAAAAMGQDIFVRFTDMMDARLAENPDRLGRSAVRRAYAIAAFRHDYDVDRAALRLAYERQGLQTTPAGQMAEAAQAAAAFGAFGLKESARAILGQMHNDGLGYSRSPRKDAQYLLWQDLLTRACEEDPAGRTERLRFFGRLVDGMSKTEGYSAGRRLIPALLNQAALAGPALARAAADLAEETGLVTWPWLVSGLLTGLVRRRPDLSATAGVVFGRVALPVTTKDDDDDSFYPHLIMSAPGDQVEGVVRHAVVCLETDCPPDRRIRSLEKVEGVASERGAHFAADILPRWRAEFSAPGTGSSSEDPFGAVATLEELAHVIAREGNSNAWGAPRAFESLTPTSDYDTAKALFEVEPMLRGNERSIDAIATAAVNSGHGTDAVSYLDRLKKIADDRGSWGGSWQSDAKRRFYRLRVRMEGEAARCAAFDAFIDDLAKGLVSVESLLPDLCDVLELMSPQASWARAWACLCEHLGQFREHRIGRDMEPVTDVGEADENTVADVLFRAIDTTSIELARMARAATGELAQSPGGPTVAAVLLPRLWRAGGHHALEAAQIAWECRDNVTIRDAVIPHLPEMASSEDYAVRRTAVALAYFWGQQPAFWRGQLPAIYKLELPPNPQAGRFDPPSGISSVCAGLWTEDPYAWTWPLKEPLTSTARASGQQLINLRARAAELMSRMGGSAVFGPKAIERQMRRLERFSLRVPYRKLGTSAAFAAMRQVIGELVAADAIDARALPIILRQAAAFDPMISSVPASPRPIGVPRVEMLDLLRSNQGAAWRSAVADDAMKPTVAGFVVLASTSVHERRYIDAEWVVEQYSGPDFGIADEGVWWQLARLPRVVFAEGIYPLYKGFALGAVVYAEPDIARLVEPCTVMLCPHVANAVGLHAHPRNPFSYLDDEERVVAKTLHWRDGGVFQRSPDNAVRGQGYLLLVAEESWHDLRPYLSPAQVAVAWRVTEKIGEDKRMVASASVKLAG